MPRWSTLTTQDVLLQWMTTNENPCKIELDRIVGDEQVYYVHVHCRYEAVSRCYSDRTCIECFVVKNKLHSQLLIEQLKKHKICWKRTHAHGNVPTKIARIDFLNKIDPLVDKLRMSTPNFVWLPPCTDINALKFSEVA
jgi:hypothetical protein